MRIPANRQGFYGVREDRSSSDDIASRFTMSLLTIIVVADVAYCASGVGNFRRCTRASEPKLNRPASEMNCPWRSCEHKPYPSLWLLNLTLKSRGEKCITLNISPTSMGHDNRLRGMLSVSE